MEPEAENPTTPTPPEIEPIKKKEEKVAPPPPEDVQVKTEVTSPPPSTTTENLTVKAEMTPPTPPTPPTPSPTMQTPKVETTPPVEVQLPNVEIKVSGSPDEPDFTTTTQTQWQQFGEQISEILDRLPDSVGNFFRDYQRPLTVVGAIIASIIALKVISGLLDTFNEIPFFEPFFQLIGIIYSGWFVYRYLLNAGNRQELWQIIDDYKAQVFGSKKP
ncbi:CAAD domain-containing protein [Floridanema aerugineum]|uniref:CAAD domain-containing protein n=1 Tax=Floridaenema aerugineum BLCC-F46 TaxID=3153654 RepID=A0ABV4XGQ8_9CYAN